MDVNDKEELIKRRLIEEVTNSVESTLKNVIHG